VADTRPLGYEDEPQESGAVVAVNHGDYRSQELWVRSGSNIGNWFCLSASTGDPGRGTTRAVSWRDWSTAGPLHARGRTRSRATRLGRTCWRVAR